MKAKESIIFDLGKVLVNLDYSLTTKAFEKLNGKDFNFTAPDLHYKQLFDRFETGKISAKEFRDIIRKKLDIKVDDATIDSAWNAMLLDVPTERMQLLTKLKQQYSLYLLSNTNEIHIRYFLSQVNSTYGENTFSGLFKKLYYSYEMGMRKPSVEIYNRVLQDNELDPEQTLFIDDALENINGAIKTNMRCHHLKEGESIVGLNYESYFS